MSNENKEDKEFGFREYVNENFPLGTIVLGTIGIICILVNYVARPEPGSLLAALFEEIPVASIAIALLWIIKFPLWRSEKIKKKEAAERPPLSREEWEAERRKMAYQNHFSLMVFSLIVSILFWVPYTFDPSFKTIFSQGAFLYAGLVSLLVFVIEFAVLVFWKRDDDQ